MARVERFAAMGTRIELHVFGDGDPEALTLARRAIEAVDDALTIHRPSPTTAVNECLLAGRSAAIDDAILLDALEAVAAVWPMTGGMFDPTAGSGAGRWSAISVDREAARISVTMPLALDFGGFGKGFALDRAVAALRAGGVDCAFLSAGESSIAVIGDHPLGGAWPVAIPHPFRADAPLVEIALSDAALSISSTIGAAARGAMIRATDGAVVTRPATAIAVAATGAEAEAVSTALLVAPDVAAQRLFARDPSRRYRYVFDAMSSLPGVLA